MNDFINAPVHSVWCTCPLCIDWVKRQTETKKHDDGGRTRMGNTPTCETCGETECVCGDNEETTNTNPAHVTGLKAQLAAVFPWLTTDDEDEQSGADVIDQLQQFYDNLTDDAIGLSGRDERKDFQK